MKIVERRFAEADRRALLESGMHPVLAKLFASRRIRSAEELDYGPTRLHAPGLMKSVEAAAVLLADAIAAR
jgi:single-stranded-DNA-specific exonuclease